MYVDLSKSLYRFDNSSDPSDHLGPLRPQTLPSCVIRSPCSMRSWGRTVALDTWILEELKPESKFDVVLLPLYAQI